MEEAVDFGGDVRENFSHEVVGGRLKLIRNKSRGVGVNMYLFERWGNFWMGEFWGGCSGQRKGGGFCRFISWAEKIPLGGVQGVGDRVRFFGMG